MEYRNVGRSGLAVSALGLGCNNFGMRIDQTGADAVVGAALDAGITLFDTADIYGGGESERMLGKALSGRRHEVTVATKFGIRKAACPVPRGGSRTHVLRACEDSLRRLGTDYIDLYLLHKPDPHTPIEETLDALDTLVRAGKVRYAAASNLAAWQLAEAHHLARARGTAGFVAIQAEWSLLRREVERELLPAALHLGVGVMPYFPLASGLLTGKYTRGAAAPADARLAALPEFAAGILNEANLGRVERLAALAGEHGLSVLELAMSWLAGRAGVASVLFGATRPEQVAQNVAAAGKRLDTQLCVAIDRLDGAPAPD